MISWYYLEAGQPVGPFLPDALIKLKEVGLIHDNTLVRADESSQWFVLSDIIADIHPGAIAVAASAPNVLLDGFYYLNDAGEQAGPFNAAEIQSLRKRGRIRDKTLIACTGDENWRTVAELLGPDSHQATVPVAALPAPPLFSPHRPSDRKSKFKTISGVTALILSVLTAFSIRGCVTAERKLEAFTNGSDPDEVPRMIVDTGRGISQGDPFRAISGMMERKETLTQEAGDSRFGAWLFLICAVTAGACFYRARRPGSSMRDPQEP